MRCMDLAGLGTVLLFVVIANVNAQRGSVSVARCGPSCRKFCPNGFETDERGCPICRCKQKPQKSVKVDRCGPLCRRFCPRGFERDERGCPICRCSQGPSMSMLCPIGTLPATPMRPCSSSKMSGRDECGKRRFCHPAGGSSHGICCRRRKSKG